jgi:hypothetical protein
MQRPGALLLVTGKMNKGSVGREELFTIREKYVFCPVIPPTSR